MPRRSDAVRLRHMLDHTQEALAMVRGRTRADLDSDRMMSLALVRLLEIIGESAGRVSAQEQANHPRIPWPQLVGLRNRLIHGYDQVDLDILWRIVTQDLPALVAELAQIVAHQAG